MNNENQYKDLLELFQKNPPKVIGGYKKQGWAVKIVENISNEPVEIEEDGSFTAKAVLKANDQTFYPAFLTLDLNKKGQVIGVYFISENEEQFDLIPFEIAKQFIKKSDEELLPFKYHTLEKINGDEIQSNWPEFT